MAFKCKPDLKCWCGLQVAEPVWASEAGYCDEALTRRQLAIYDFLAVGWPLVFCSTPSLVEGAVGPSPSRCERQSHWRTNGQAHVTEQKCYRGTQGEQEILIG